MNVEPLPRRVREKAKLEALAVGESFIDVISHNDVCRLHMLAKRLGMKISGKLVEKPNTRRITRVE